MLLYTPPYLLFLAGVAAVHWLLPRPGWRRAWLLAASYAFYALFDWRFALLLAALTGVTYGLGQGIARGWRPRLLARLSVVISLGVLAVFKYAGFFLANAQALLVRAGAPLAVPSLALLLPIGISFYTFQAIAYTIEVYRGKVRPPGWLDLALYLAFFPKLVAGPLVSPVSFWSQAVERPRAVETSAALRLLVLGLVKKVLIADSLAGLADAAFRAASLPAGAQFATPLYLQGFYLYAFQIYADFSGYTDLALGSAALLGYRLPPNFRQPYLAVTLADFWNRWHMSLTQWFREYLFFPLSRWLLARSGRVAWRAPAAQVVANLTTMTLIGLWHGAAWTFVLWGFWHGLLLSAERLARYQPAGRWRRLASGVLTFHLVAIGWVLFRSDSLAGAGRFLAGLVSWEQMHWLGYFAPVIVLTAALVFGLDLAASRVAWPRAVEAHWPRWRPAFVVASLVVLAGLGLLGFARGGDTRPFIYGLF